MRTRVGRRIAVAATTAASVAMLGMSWAGPAQADTPPRVVAVTSAPRLSFPSDWAQLQGQTQPLPAGNWSHVDWSSLPGMRVASTERLDGIPNPDGDRKSVV